MAALHSPQSLADGLPSAFLGNDFTREFVAAFDEVLAPVFTTLDGFDAYLDPRYAPEDFLWWLASWLGFPLDERWSAAALRLRLGDAVEALLWRGTVKGVGAAVRAYTGEQPDVRDSGGVISSVRPLGPLPGDARPLLTVRVRSRVGDFDVDADVLERIIAQVKPANVPHELVLTAERP